MIVLVFSTRIQALESILIHLMNDDICCFILLWSVYTGLFAGLSSLPCNSYKVLLQQVPSITMQTLHESVIRFFLSHVDGNPQRLSSKGASEAASSDVGCLPGTLQGLQLRVMDAA